MDTLGPVVLLLLLLELADDETSSLGAIVGSLLCCFCEASPRLLPCMEIAVVTVVDIRAFQVRCLGVWHHWQEPAA